MQEVCVDGKWLTRQQVAEIASQDKRLADYRKLRDQAAATVADQAALARWCKKSKLPDEERVHWLAVLRLAPDNAEAIKGLGLHPYQGMLLTNAEIAQCKAEAAAMNKATERWRPLVSRWAAAIEKEDGPGAAAVADDREPARHGSALALVRGRVQPDCGRLQHVFRGRAPLVGPRQHAPPSARGGRARAFASRAGRVA
jgi:hypothetical protein